MLPARPGAGASSKLLYDPAGTGQIFGSLVVLHHFISSSMIAGSTPSCDQVLIASHRSVPSSSLGTEPLAESSV